MGNFLTRVARGARRYSQNKKVTILINNNKWSAVSKFVGTVGDHERTWNIGGVFVKNNILLSIADRDWTCIKETNDDRFPGSTFQWIIRQACTRATQSEVVQFVLPHCADDRLDSVLTILVERLQWTAVIQVLARGVSDFMKQWAVRETCEHCEDYELEFLINILPHCAVEQLNSVLTTLVERRKWRAAGKILKKSVSESNKQWAVQEACKHCEDYDIESLILNILPHCANDQLESVLTTLVERHKWIAVEEMLKKGVSDSNKQWAVQEACRHCNDYELEILILNILPYCTDDQLKSVLTTLVERHKWRTVGTILKIGVSSFFNERWAVQEACKRCTNCELESLIQYILPHCAVYQLESVLTTLVERRLWKAVLYVLTRGVSDSSKRWVVFEVCACCKSVSQEQISKMLLFCADDQADCVLTTLVEQRHWLAVEKMLKKGVSDSYKQWAVREACKHCEAYDVTKDHTLWGLNPPSKQEYKSLVEHCLVNDMLPHCADDQLDSVLTPLVERRLWQAVLYVLKRGVSDSSKRWVVLEVCACCESGVQEQVLSDILLLCADDLADVVLTTLVERRQWSDRREMLKFVVKLLKQCVRETVGTRLVEEAWKATSRHDFIKYVLPHCPLSHLNSVMPNFVKQGELTTVNIVMRRHRKDMEMESFVLPRWYVDVLPSLVEHRLWNYVQDILHSVVMNTLCLWRTQEVETKEVLLAMVNTCRVNAKYAVQLFKAVKEKTANKVRELRKCLGLEEDLCELMYTSLLDQVCVALCSEEKKTDVMTDPIHSLVRGIYTDTLLCLETIRTHSVKSYGEERRSDERDIPTVLAVFISLGIRAKITTLNTIVSSPIQRLLHTLKQLKLYYTCRQGDSDDEVLLLMFAVLPLSPGLQSVALRIMLRHKRWDVISQADLSGVWEQDRRHLLQAAVKQRQWSVVKRWADHTLYDDQRVWALNEALNEKQWDVALLLADHGLTDIDLMRVHYRLAKYADWNVILHMFERGADVAEVKERLRRMKDNKRIPENVICCIHDRCSKVAILEKEIQMAKLDALETACRSCNWIFVLFTLFRNPINDSVHSALKTAIRKKAWHVVIQLVRIGMDAKQRHSLFSRMMKRRQWGVCRVLLEQGMSVQLCLKVLPQLMDMNQWALVARVMEHDVGDDVRHQVMQRAWERREGSVVWLCIKYLPTPLSVEEREALFERAFSCELWQVIKPLVEEKDDTGIRHRDTALLEAIDQHEWDLVDHCQLHHADINMEDDDGHTPLQRAAMKKDWEAVEELVVRDGDPNLLDRDGYTVLHRAIKEKQWRTVKLLIEYQADIHTEDKSSRRIKGRTPLDMLIDSKRVDIIAHTLIWCPEQSKGVNDMRETTLHAACLSGCYDSMYYLVARGVNPVGVTLAGQSALVYAVLNKDCPQRMVSECIRLGFSTHQPQLTNTEENLESLLLYNRYAPALCFPDQEVTSPFLCALLRGLPVVAQMLYQSGACSHRELFRLYTELPTLADPNTANGKKLQERAGHAVVAYQNFVYCIENVALPYLTEITTTPRSLVSTCRLVISHCLTLSKKRHRDVDKLPLTERMKKFVLFSDLTDPDFGNDTT